MNSKLKYEIVDDEVTGERLNLISPYSDEVQDLIDERKIQSILLSQRLGWESQSIDFLKEINGLKCLYLYDDELLDLSVIEELYELELLFLECRKVKISPNFESLNKLNYVSIDWRPCFKSLYLNTNIQKMRIDYFNDNDLSKFSVSPKLEELDLVMGPITSLKGIENFPNLKKLVIYRCTKLTDISELEHIELTNIEIESCKKIDNLEILFNVNNLESIIIDKCHEIKSIKDISNLSNLKKARIINTTILDGDVTKFGSLYENGVEISFDNKKSYSHKLEDFIGKPEW